MEEKSSDKSILDPRGECKKFHNKNLLTGGESIMANKNKEKKEKRKKREKRKKKESRGK